MHCFLILGLNSYEQVFFFNYIRFSCLFYDIVYQMHAGIAEYIKNNVQ